MNRAVSSMFTNEELMSIDDLLLQISDDMLPSSITAIEITKIRLGEFFSTNEVQERDVHLTSLPRISTHDKGKAILEEDEPIRGNPSSELVELICGDIEFLIMIRDQPWTATTSQIIDLLSDAHSISLEDLLAQQHAHGLPMEQPCASTVFDSSVDRGAALARFYSVAKSTCWKMPKPVIDHIFVPHVLVIEPVPYWEAAPWLIRTWQWTKVCTEITQFSMTGCLRPVRENVFQGITVYNLGIERIPADFLSMFAQGMACHSFVDSVVQGDSRDIWEVNIKDVEEVDLASSDGSTVYRSPSPSFQEVNSIEHDLHFALGPAIFPNIRVNAQADTQTSTLVDFTMFTDALEDLRSSISQRIHDSNCEIFCILLWALLSFQVLHRRSDFNIRVNAQADTQTSTLVDFTMFTDALEDLRSSISQCIHDSNCEILSKVNAIEISVREALLKQHALLRQSLQDACRVQERQGVSQEMQIHDLKKGLLAPVATVFQDLMAIKKGQREQDAKITALDTQVVAIRGKQLDFQSKIAADILSLSTQFGDIVDFIRGDDAKKGEIGSSSPARRLFLWNAALYLLRLTKVKAAQAIVILEIFEILGLEVSAGDSFDDVMLCVGIVVADTLLSSFDGCYRVNLEFSSCKLFLEEVLVFVVDYQFPYLEKYFPIFVLCSSTLGSPGLSAGHGLNPAGRAPGSG
ncbi:myb-related protein Hv1-like [Dorcoceras hygrometricum]|uniref:Myb-related protein Hv1-like n=1 Tax=Dorcoceras hygrometricum TaxID=472368 RepID=A0A2Z7CDW1_9LAMI|nr:myb-related protein Hv1-like [Dorcoceras hygrometricum]